MPKVDKYSSFGVVVDAPDKPEPEPAPPPKKLKADDIVKKFGWPSADCVVLAINRFGFPKANGIESGWVGNRAAW